jgi:hypothetical protein
MTACHRSAESTSATSPSRPLEQRPERRIESHRVDEADAVRRLETPSALRDVQQLAERQERHPPHAARLQDLERLARIVLAIDQHA